MESLSSGGLVQMWRRSAAVLHESYDLTIGNVVAVSGTSTLITLLWSCHSTGQSLEVQTSCTRRSGSGQSLAGERSLRVRDFVVAKSNAVGKMRRTMVGVVLGRCLSHSSEREVGHGSVWSDLSKVGV